MTDPWDDDDLGTPARRRKHNPWLARMALSVGLCCFAGMLVWGALSLASDGKQAKKQIVQISLLKLPPPPPPPPPPPEQKPPEPEVKDEVNMPEPEPQPQQADEAPPANEQLGLDADGSGGGDAFGLAAKKGGRDITTIGGGGGNNRAQFAWFTGLVQSHLQEQLQKNERLRKQNYRLTMKVWFKPDGSVERYELVGPSGDDEIDRNLKIVMQELPPLRQVPPAELPQPLKVRVTSRLAG